MLTEEEYQAQLPEMMAAIHRAYEAGLIDEPTYRVLTRQTTGATHMPPLPVEGELVPYPTESTVRNDGFDQEDGKTVYMPGTRARPSNRSPVERWLKKYHYQVKHPPAFPPEWHKETDKLERQASAAARNQDPNGAIQRNKRAGKEKRQATARRWAEQGLVAKQIALKMDITVRAVQNYLKGQPKKKRTHQP